jgi:hypothetical protein
MANLKNLHEKSNSEKKLKIFHKKFGDKEKMPTFAIPIER